MDLSSPNTVREFLALCLNPGRGTKRTPANLAKIMPGALGAAVDRFAPHLAQLRKAADEADRQARAARKAYTDGLAAWIASGETPPEASAVADPSQCPQNRKGTFIYLTDPANLGPHFYKDDGVHGPRCVYCDMAAHWGGEPLVAPCVPTYVFNAASVNTTAKHFIDPLDPRTTLCEPSRPASAPMTVDEAARLPLCGACRRIVTGEQE